MFHNLFLCCKLHALTEMCCRKFYMLISGVHVRRIFAILLRPNINDTQKV